MTHEKALHKQSPGILIFIQKYIHDKLPKNQRQHLFYSNKTNLCSACNQEEETIKHILQCQACEKRNTIQSNYIKQLQNYLDKFRIQPSINNIIMQNVIAWLQNKTPPTTREIEPNASHKLLQTIQFQNKIGWNNWFTGRHSQNWGFLFNFEHDNTTPGNKHITRDIITTTWNFVHEVWLQQNITEYES
jgi:hypothetical protein